jgi:propanol-preferring alcohol dehydrogenase
VLKLARHLFPRSPVSVFSRSPQEQQFAMELGAAWAGPIDGSPPELLDCIIDTTPAWKPVIESLRCLAPGGRLVINAIRKEPGDSGELLRLDYPAHLWNEKEIKSVANVTRADIRAFLSIAAEAGLKPEVQAYVFQEANAALRDLKRGRVRGAKILMILKSEI